ncbi:HAD family phosphatase [Micromonospora sp. NPDC005174]|uniref:HAD family phosphatase n=1 Tax=Micromonospora sp. NPDC005174 TaxID=3157018 RepID=UPI0033B89E18
MARLTVGHKAALPRDIIPDMLLAQSLAVPRETQALLLDMDGVLIDSLALDFAVVERLLRRHVPGVAVPLETIKRYFPYSLPDFWARVCASVDVRLTDQEITDLVRSHEEERLSAVADVHAGVPELLRDARSAGLRLAVVSNNPKRDVERILASVKLRDLVDAVVGNDAPGMERKPAPDPYLAAAAELGVAPDRCVAIEDSVLGLQAARDAGCYTVGVATGASSLDELSGSGLADRCHRDLRPNMVSLGREGITRKSLDTPNDFVSHMVEHIAWRLGCSIELRWNNDDWRGLGTALGTEIARIPRLSDSAAALGMIDDGSAEVQLRVDPEGGASFHASPQVDLDWFLSVRCEQLSHGAPLVDLLDALGRAAGLWITVTVASFEDPHHTWEGVYRAVGIALDRMCNPLTEESTAAAAVTSSLPEHSGERAVERGWRVESLSTGSVRLSRATAESVVAVEVSMGDPGADVFIEVADSVRVTGFAGLVDAFAREAGLRVSVRFEATRLSSSHVVTEDVGLALGRALRYLAIERISEVGIYGAGSNVRAVADLDQPVRVGVSMEGRKFWKYVPLDQTYPEFRRSFLIGHDLCGDLFSEDLDDFVDGFAGGLQASVMVHIRSDVGAEKGWPLLFAAMGQATQELLSVNPYRKALAPGVKATLA